jgi:hypothetical protein
VVSATVPSAAQVTSNQAKMKPIRSKWAHRCSLFTVSAACGLASLQSHASEAYPAVQTLTQGGSYPVNGLAGDAFGQVVAFNRDFLFVASPGSQPGNKSIAGAVFVYRRSGGSYQQTQVITTAGTGDHLGMLQILSQDDWLMLGVNGTPVGPQPNDAITDQNFQGAVLIYRYNQQNGQWELAQKLDASLPALSELSYIANGGIPVLETQQGGNFGLRMALDAERGWLLVAALYQNRLDTQNQVVMNAGHVYAFQLKNTGVWQWTQTLTNPDGAFLNDAFGAAVAVKGRVAMIGNGSVFQGPHVGNSAVYVYALNGSTWSFSQRLVGTQDAVTPLLFPQFSGAQLGIGDAFGNSIALGENDAVITAPLETPASPAFTGAAYFFRRRSDRGTDRWVLSQRVESDDSNSLAFGAFNVGFRDDLAVISDLGRTGPAGPFQGAAHLYKRKGTTWDKMTTFVDPAGTPSEAFGAGVAIAEDHTVAIGSSPFLGFFVPVIFRPPPAAAPPVAPGKVILYAPE